MWALCQLLTKRHNLKKYCISLILQILQQREEETNFMSSVGVGVIIDLSCFLHWLLLYLRFVPSIYQPFLRTMQWKSKQTKLPNTMKFIQSSKCSIYWPSIVISNHNTWLHYVVKIASSNVELFYRDYSYRSLLHSTITEYIHHIQFVLSTVLLVGINDNIGIPNLFTISALSNRSVDSTSYTQGLSLLVRFGDPSEGSGGVATNSQYGGFNSSIRLFRCDRIAGCTPGRYLFLHW